MSLREPPLRDRHEEAGASFTDFGGWEMPVEFDSIREEHQAVRDAVGKFDVSHMGEVTVSGPDATTLMQRLVTNDVAALDPGEAQYAAITDEDGIIQDDTVLYNLPASEAADYLFIPNAGHDEEAAARWESYRDDHDLDATVENHTTDYGMIALQGPDAPDLLAPETDVDLDALGRFDVAAGRVAGVDALVAATGYTGEAGYEILPAWEDTADVWKALACQPVGLGARDTLRLEAGFLLSGQDFHPEENPRTPFEAGISFVVDLETTFVGRDALADVAERGPTAQLVGLRLEERGIPRHGYDVQTPKGEQIGTVTSGTMSPTLGEAIALAYVPTDYADPDTAVEVVIRDEPKKARTTTPGFLP